MKQSNVYVSWLLVVVAATLSLSASAEVVLIDFGINSQYPGVNAFWNHITGGSADVPTSFTNLINAKTGADTGWTLSVAEKNGLDSFGVANTPANWDGPYPASISPLPQMALRDSIYIQDTDRTGVLTFSNLNASATYDILLYGARGNNGADSDFEITAAATPGATGTIENVFQNSTDTVQFLRVAPTAGGVITIEWTSDTASSGTAAALNFIQMCRSAPAADSTVIDFGHEDQKTSGIWNNIYGGTSSLNLISENTGLATGWTLSVAEKTGQTQNYGVAGTAANWDGTYPAEIADQVQDALRDGLYVGANNRTGVLTFSGLDPADFYNILLYGARGNNGADSDFEITAAATPGATGTIPDVYQNSSQTVQFRVAPTSGGVITIEWTSDTASTSAGAALNFIQFSRAPAGTVISIR